MIGGGAARAALRVLRVLRERYPHALKVGNDLVLALLELEGLEAARAELTALEREFTPAEHEETQSRLGRLYRDLGDSALARQPDVIGRRLALGEYETAWEHYDRGYALRKGHYPGINRAALFLLRAWLTPEPDRAAQLVQQARAAAQELLDLRAAGGWPTDFPDDDIWHAATEAEAQLLLGRPREARQLYQRALDLAEGKPFYKGSIGNQVARLLPALRQCLAMPEEAVQEIAGLFR